MWTPITYRSAAINPNILSGSLARQENSMNTYKLILEFFIIFYFAMMRKPKTSVRLQMNYIFTNEDDHYCLYLSRLCINFKHWIKTILPSQQPSRYSEMQENGLWVISTIYLQIKRVISVINLKYIVNKFKLHGWE